MRFTPYLLLLPAIAACGLYYAFSPARVRQRQAEHMLAEFADKIESKDRTQISQALGIIISDNAKIQLEIQFFAIIASQAPKPIAQEFTKPEFITFIDNILYTMTDYDYRAELQSFHLNPDQSADVFFTSKEWSDGDNYYEGNTIKSRFSSDTECKSHILFERKQPIIDSLVCVQHLRIIPKPQEAGKLIQNPEAMRQLLR